MVEPRVLLAHGGGGSLTRQLIRDMVVSRFGNPALAPLSDSALLDLPAGRVAFTTDSYVVKPLRFRGGDIGRLAVCGTVNDLAVMGAVPGALSLAVVMEEGLPLATLDRIVESISAAADEANVVIATGDTKVVERSRGDGMTITTAGVGQMRPNVQLGVERIAPGDVIIVTGRIAEHGLAVMSAREGLAFQTELRSDVAPLGGLIAAVLDIGADVKFLRDPTRGGLAGVLADLAEETGFTIEAHEEAIPISRVARHTAELLGLDPLTVANEGKCVIVASPGDAARILHVCKSHSYGRHAAEIGRVRETKPPLVELVTRSGGRRVVQRPYGEELPRIC